MSAAATPTVRPKEFHFPLAVQWEGSRRVAACVEGKDAIEIAPPPVFQGGEDPAIWSPEDLLVAAAATCLAVTFTGLAGRAGLAYDCLKVEADGVCSVRSDGRFGFTRLLLKLELKTDATEEPLARELAQRAEENCLVSASLDVAVETVVEVRHA